MPDPDYIVTEVSYDAEHSLIEEVRRWQYDGRAGEATNEQEVDREELIASVEGSEEHYTAPRDGEKNLQWGQKIEVLEIDDDLFVRVDGTPIRQDNLGDLQEY